MELLLESWPFLCPIAFKAITNSVLEDISSQVAEMFGSGFFLSSLNSACSVMSLCKGF